MMACAGGSDSRRPVSRRSRPGGDPRRRTHQRPPGLQVDRSGDAGDRAAADPDRPSASCDDMRPAGPASTVPWLATYGDVTRPVRRSHPASDALRLPVTGSSRSRHPSGKNAGPRSPPATRRLRSGDADVEIHGPRLGAAGPRRLSQPHGDPARPVVDPLGVDDRRRARSAARRPARAPRPRRARSARAGARRTQAAVAAPDGDQAGLRTPGRWCRHRRAASASSHAWHVPSVGWPAKGSSVTGVKIRTR